MKSFLLHKFENICIKTILWTIGIQTVALFLYIGTLGEKAI